MLNGEMVAKELESSLEFFLRSTRVLDEEDSGFTPAGELYSVAQQVAHTAQTLDWFREGAFGTSGWTMDFEKHDRETRAVTSLSEAREKLVTAMAELVARVRQLSDEEWASPFPADDPIMPGAPRISAIFGIVDHTAHHRGALTMYTRLLGKTPLMPYMEM